MPHPRFSTEEIGKRGRQWYEQSIRAQVETPENIGRIVAIDIETGDFEVADENLQAVHQCFLALPPSAVAALGLEFQNTIRANLANDADVEIELYEVTILWNGVEQVVDVLSTGQRSLLGTSLLDGFHMGVDFAEGGLVDLYLLSSTDQTSL